MYTISMKNLAESVGLDKELFYRPNAVKMYENVVRELQHIKGGTMIECSFEAINGCDASFADGFVIKLQKHIQQFNNVVLYLSNCNEAVLENLRAALMLRNEMDKTKINILYYDTSFQFLVKQEANLHVAFEYVQKVGETTARDIAEVFDIEINSASNRLKKLYDSNKLFRREIKDEKGRQHIYFIKLP